jgi:uncharacterized protein YbcI
MDAPPQSHGEMLASISNGLVKLHTRYYGKGPTRAKTYLINDTVICMLEEGFTTVERTLIDGGRAEAVHEIRRTFQQAMERQFTDVVESATGRKVIAYLSQVHTDPDLAVELFVLTPVKGQAPKARDEPVAAVAVLDSEGSAED